MDLAFALALLLAASTPERDAVRGELEAVAARIEVLKARRAHGDEGVHAELHALLVRSQELAIVLDRIDHPKPEGTPLPRLRGPTPDDLRERADAARDEADRIRSALEQVERRIAQVSASARSPAARLAGVGAAEPTASPARRVELLEAQRERLLRTLARVLADAERLEAEAELLEQLP